MVTITTRRNTDLFKDGIARRSGGYQQAIPIVKAVTLRDQIIPQTEVWQLLEYHFAANGNRIIYSCLKSGRELF